MNEHPISNVDVSHHIQRHVLMQLRQEGSQTYQQLKMDGLEGNGFNYHLKLLKQSRLIASSGSNYTLTPTGMLVADAFSYESKRLVMRPHCFTYLLVTQGEHVLVYEPTRQPTEGKQCLVSGKLHYGDSIETSIKRELLRRGLLTTDLDFTPVCPINTRYKKDGEVVLHRPGVVWHVEYKGERVASETPSGLSYWAKTDDLAPPRALPDMIEALNHFSTGNTNPIDGEFFL